METLQTVFDQSYSNYEIIVVDNCSDDDTVERLRPLEESGRIRLIVNEKNLERARARNVGMKAAKGDYLTLLDSDDFLYKEYLKRAHEHIAKGRRTDFFHSYYELVDDDKKPLYQYRFPPEGKQIRRLAMGNFISCIGVFLSKKVFREYQFNEDEKILGSEDWELWLRVRAAYQLGVIPSVNCGVRNHPGRSIGGYQIQSIIDRKNYIIDHILSDDKRREVYQSHEKDMRAAVYVFAATSCNEGRLFKEAKIYLKKALKLKKSLILDPHFIRVAQIANFKIEKDYLINDKEK